MVKSTPKFWDIPPLRRTCSACQSSFQPEQEYLSILMDDDEPKRHDYCKECHPVESDGLSKWRGVIASATKKSFRQVDYHLLDILLELLEKEEDSLTAFFIANYLRRKGFLRLCHSIRRKKETFDLYEMHDQEKTFAVPHCSLSPTEARLQKDKILELLEDNASTG